MLKNKGKKQGFFLNSHKFAMRIWANLCETKGQNTHQTKYQHNITELGMAFLIIQKRKKEDGGGGYGAHQRIADAGGNINQSHHDQQVDTGTACTGEQ